MEKKLSFFDQNLSFFWRNLIFLSQEIEWKNPDDDMCKSIQFVCLCCKNCFKKQKWKEFSNVTYKQCRIRVANIPSIKELISNKCLIYIYLLWVFKTKQMKKNKNLVRIYFQVFNTKRKISQNILIKNFSSCSAN